MPLQDVPLGKRFTQVYGEQGEPTADSVRMRARLAAVVANREEDVSIAKAIERRIGLVVGFAHGYRDWRSFFAKQALGDVLDTVTVVAHVLDAGDVVLYGARAPLKKRRAFISSVAQILAEENVSYEIDAEGGVHRKVDAAFAASKHAVVGTLSAPRYANALQNLMTGLTALDQTPPDHKTAVRQVFSATEGLFRLMFPRAPRLAADQVKMHLRPLIEARNENDRSARSAELEMASSFERWVDASHWYRHEQGREDPHQPTQETAVLLVGVGIAWLRWLASLDASMGQ